MRIWEEAHPNRPTRTAALAFALVVALVCLTIILLGGTRAGANAPPADNPNEYVYWCGANGVKYDPVDTPFIVPAPPEGTVWTLLVIKAGSEESTPNPYNQIVDPVVGQAYYHDSGKQISHVVLCWAPTPTTTTAPTTTGASTTTAPTTTGATTTAGTTTTATTLATTTTGATTTSPTTSSRGGDCEVNCTTTTAATTTVPQTTTPRGGDCQVNCGTTTTTVVNTTQETVPATTTTVKATTTTAATTTAPPPTDAADQTLPAAPTSTPTQLPVTGGSPWWLALFGVCLIALGGLLVAWKRTA